MSLRKQLKRKILLMSAVGIFGCDKSLTESEAQLLYERPRTNSQSALTVYHLGHSLVGVDMPFMLQQLSPNGHSHGSQLGWGASLRQHFEPNIPVNGFEKENGHSNFQEVHEAISSGTYNTFVLTEMVEIKDAIKYHETPKYLKKFANSIYEANPEASLFLYETWHHTNDSQGWLNRLESDYPEHWLKGILFKAQQKNLELPPIYIIPAGQAFLNFFRKVESQGGIGEINAPTDIFKKNDDGSQDTIHLNDLGNYFVALIHYAVLYQNTPEGLPVQLYKPDGSPYIAPSEVVAVAMQEVAWKTVSMIPTTGVKQEL